MSATVSSWVRTALGVRLGEDGADGLGDRLTRLLRDHREHVAQEVNPAALVPGAEHDLPDGFDQAGVVVADHQPDPGQAAFAQGAQELGPEEFCFAVADHHPEDFAAAVLGDPGGDHHRPRDDLVLDARLAVGGVEVHVREPDVVERPGAERDQLGVEVGADPGDLALGDPGVRAECLDQVVDRAGGDAVDVGFHDDGVEGLVDPAAPFEQGWEEGAGAQLGDGQVQVAGLGGEGLVPVSVAQCHAGIGVLVPSRSDPGGGLGFDQFLQHPLGHGPDEFEPVGRT
jgi:hypothetical protein